jgi:hypothetical protein
MQLTYPTAQNTENYDSYDAERKIKQSNLELLLIKVDQRSASDPDWHLNDADPYLNLFLCLKWSAVLYNKRRSTALTESMSFSSFRFLMCSGVKIDSKPVEAKTGGGCC